MRKYDAFRNMWFASMHVMGFAHLCCFLKPHFKGHCYLMLSFGSTESCDADILLYVHHFY